MWALGQGGTTGQQIGVHDAAVKSVRFIPEMNLVASASWSVLYCPIPQVSESLHDRYRIEAVCVFVLPQLKLFVVRGTCIPSYAVSASRKALSDQAQSKRLERLFGARWSTNGEAARADSFFEKISARLSKHLSFAFGTQR